MKFYKHLYITEDAYDSRRKTIHKLKHHKLCLNGYVVTLSTNPNNLLDIYAAKELIQPHYKKAELSVIGLAASLDDAMELVTDIIQEVYSKTNSFNIREYLRM